MISRWHVQVAVGTLKALAPFQDDLRRAKRRFFPYRTDAGIDRGLLADGLRMVDELHRAGARIDGSTVLEIGSGWHPVIPLLFHLAGARRVTMTDRVRLMDASLVASAARLIEERKEDVRAHGLQVPKTWSDALTSEFRDMEHLLEALRIDYDVPFDFSRLAAESTDIVVSRAVLEHLPPTVLAEMFAQVRRVLRPGGFVCHVIDNTDHFAHADETICYVNFLRFDDWQWRLLTLNPFSYTNRLRHSDYRALLAEAGFRIVTERARIDDRSLATLRGMHVAPRFRGKPVEDLATAISLLVASPAVAAGVGEQS